MHNPTALRSSAHICVLGDDFAVLRRAVARARPVAGVVSFAPLAQHVGTTMGLATTALGHVLATAEQPFTATSSGRSAIEYLARAAQHATEAVAQLTTALAVAAEYQRIDAQPDPLTGDRGPRAPVRREALDRHMASAVDRLALAEAACHSTAALLADAARPLIRPATAHSTPPLPTAVASRAR
ncbi:hypothetical protein [Streptomyces brasiliscabiei]|uniref:hypothetical protein n=1 Tax=Streptomyces brasiliscabiei TaxID=2736302 RepID=UPI001C11C060|nr:hypothetical protein [Streptomyces brasiliscabiei]